MNELVSVLLKCPVVLLCLVLLGGGGEGGGGGFRGWIVIVAVAVIVRVVVASADAPATLVQQLLMVGALTLHFHEVLLRNSFRHWSRQRLVGRVTSPQRVGVSQGQICSDKCTCCHTETDAADQTCSLTRSQQTYTRPTSPSTDPFTQGAWQRASTRP